MDFKPGIYKHFKGHTYKTIAIAKHSETLEPMVVYANLQDDKDVWVRPLRMFTDNVERDGKVLKRFELIEEI